MGQSRIELPPPPPQWVLDINTDAPVKTKTASVLDPPGYSPSNAPVAAKSKSGKSQVAAKKAVADEEMDTLRMKKAWEVAIAPAKSLPMSAFGMWMTGNSLQIFSIFMVFTLFKTPIEAFLNINNMFKRFESDGTRSKMLQVKFVYALTNLLALGLGIYKVNAMGLLPTTRSDWLAWETQRIPLERAYPVYDS